MAPVNPLDVTGNAGISGGLNVGTATGATVGQVKTSAAILGGGALSLSGQALAGYTQNSFALADDATANMFVEGGGFGSFMITNATTVEIAWGYYTNIVGAVITVTSGGSWAVADTDGSHCILYAAPNLTLKNRTGGARTYRVHRFY